MKYIIFIILFFFSISITSCKRGGCTDLMAVNYDYEADYDDGSCTYVTGCTNPIATNYNPYATYDDGSCQFNCSCGYITADGIDSSTNCYWLEIKNDCTGNKRIFCFSYDIWLNNYVGDRFCVTNVSSW